jgi:hypothetical protein
MQINKQFDFRWALVAFAMLGSSTTVADPVAASADYHVRQVVKLRADADSGFVGQLILLEDSRLTRPIRNQLKKYKDCGVIVANESTVENQDAISLCESVEQEPLRGAMIQVVDSAGRIVDSHSFERELGSVEAVHLYGNATQTYLVTIDFSIGFGSYNGPITSFIEISRDGHILWLPISGMRSLKTDWRIISVKGSTTKEVLHVACRPDFRGGGETTDDQPFLVTYTTSYFSDGVWKEKERAVSGFWESEGAFPNRKLFPR